MCAWTHRTPCLTKGTRSMVCPLVCLGFVLCALLFSKEKTKMYVVSRVEATVRLFRALYVQRLWRSPAHRSLACGHVCARVYRRVRQDTWAVRVRVLLPAPDTASPSLLWTCNLGCGRESPFTSREAAIREYALLVRGAGRAAPWAGQTALSPVCVTYCKRLCNFRQLSSHRLTPP